MKEMEIRMKDEAERNDRYYKMMEDSKNLLLQTIIEEQAEGEKIAATYIQWQVRNRQLRTETHQAIAKSIQELTESGHYNTEQRISRLREYKSSILHLLGVKATNNAVEEWKRTVRAPIIKLLVGRAIQQLSSATTIQ